MTPILLIHGLFGSLSDSVILDAFGDQPVLAPDLLGYGANRTAAPTWTLDDQADHVAAFVRSSGKGPVHAVGHSVGGAVAMLFARHHPTLVSSVTSVEGNFTLRDAFWSQKISTEELSVIEQEVANFRNDVSAWLTRSGVPPTPWTIATGTAWLDNQPASTLRAQARAVVAATAGLGYLEHVRALLNRGMPLHLVAGERSRSGWSVPDWVVKRAASNVDMANCGHLMMLEAPRAFAQTLTTSLSY